MENIPMIAPYQVAPPQGNLLGSIMDFIGQNRALQLDAGTRNQLNGQMGYGENVDPFAMQKFQGEGQRQTIAGDDNKRAAQDQEWQGADRNSIIAVMQALGQNPQYSQDPMIGPLLQNGGANAGIGQAVMGMLGGDRSNVQNKEQDKQRHQYALEEVKARVAGQGGAAGRPEIGPRAEAAKRKYIETGDRQDAQVLGVYDEQLEQGRLDFLHNTQQKDTREGAEAVKALREKQKPQPGKVVQDAAPQSDGVTKEIYDQMNSQQRLDFERDRIRGAVAPLGELILKLIGGASNVKG